MIVQAAMTMIRQAGSMCGALRIDPDHFCINLNRGFSWLFSGIKMPPSSYLLCPANNAPSSALNILCFMIASKLVLLSK
jgi:hypothetical protein